MLGVISATVSTEVKYLIICPICPSSKVSNNEENISETET
jgi:hypothetical protein